MVRITQGQVTLGKTASFLGILQGVVWFSLSLVCIIEYSIQNKPQSSSGALATFNFNLYKFYLDKSMEVPDGWLVTSTTFIVFVSLYVMLNTAWIVTSIFQLNILRKNTVNVPILFKDWALITWIIALVDFILVVLIGADYGRSCLKSYSEEVCLNTLIPMIVIVSRGFILWFVNVILAWRLSVNAGMLRKGGSYEGTFGGIIPIFTPTGVIPRAIVSSNPSLYSQQQSVVTAKNNYWNVNLRTAMDTRTPPIIPGTPTSAFDRNSPFKY